MIPSKFSSVGTVNKKISHFESSKSIITDSNSQDLNKKQISLDSFSTQMLALNTSIKLIKKKQGITFRSLPAERTQDFTMLIMLAIYIQKKKI